LEVVTAAISLVLEFGCKVVAEHSLRRAAEAGIREAALPRANRRSVEQVIRSRIGDAATLSRSTKIQLRPNARYPNQLSVALVAPVDAALPAWLQPVTFWNSHAEITIRVGG
jgi:hypothetical protein